MLSCNGSLERRGRGKCVESDAEAPCWASRKRCDVLGKSSISCHTSGEGGARVVESAAFSRLSKRSASAPTLTVRPPSSTSASEALESSSPSRTIGLSILCQENWSSTSTTECCERAYLDYRLSYRLVLNRYYHQKSRFPPPRLHPQLRRLYCSNAGPPLQSPPSEAWYIAVVRWKEGRCRRRRCRRRWP